MEINIYQIKNKPTKSQKYPLRMFLNYGGERIPISLRERISIPAWDIKGQKATRKDPDSTEINKRISKKKAILIEVVEELVKKDIEVSQKSIGDIYYERVAVQINKKKPTANLKSLPTSKITLPKTFFECVDHYRTKSGKSKETIRKWNQLEYHLKSYNPDFDFCHISEDFYNEYYLDYLVNIPICDNTIDKHIAGLKAMCTYSVKRFPKISVSPDYIDFKRIYKNPLRMALTWEEVEKIMAFEPFTEEQVLAKDLFLISCSTGLRWQNVSDLKPHNFIERGGRLQLNIVTYKNGNPLQFTLPKTVRKIIEKYQKEIPKSYNSDVNKEIQKIARACKLDDTIYVRKMYKKKVQEVPFKKWQKMTMHVARHTFACEFLIRNKHHGLIALKGLKELLNHSSTKVTEIYWNMISGEKDEMLLNSFD